MNQYFTIRVNSKLYNCIGPVKQNCDYFLSISLNMCFEYSKEPSHQDSSFESPQHMFWLRNKKIIFSDALLSGDMNYIMIYFFYKNQ